MPRKLPRQGAALPTKAAEPHPHYSDPTAAIFRAAIAALEEKLPEEHAALAALLEDGRIHEPAAMAAVLSGGGS